MLVTKRGIGYLKCTTERLESILLGQDIFFQTQFCIEIFFEKLEFCKLKYVYLIKTFTVLTS